MIQSITIERYDNTNSDDTGINKLSLISYKKFYTLMTKSSMEKVDIFPVRQNLSRLTKDKGTELTKEKNTQSLNP